MVNTLFWPLSYNFSWSHCGCCGVTFMFVIDYLCWNFSYLEFIFNTSSFQVQLLCHESCCFGVTFEPSKRLLVSQKNYEVCDFIFLKKLQWKVDGYFFWVPMFMPSIRWLTSWIVLDTKSKQTQGQSTYCMFVYYLHFVSSLHKHDG